MLPSARVHHLSAPAGGQLDERTGEKVSIRKTPSKTLAVEIVCKSSPVERLACALRELSEELRIGQTQILKERVSRVMRLMEMAKPIRQRRTLRFSNGCSVTVTRFWHGEEIAVVRNGEGHRIDTVCKYPDAWLSSDDPLISDLSAIEDICVHIRSPDGTDEFTEIKYRQRTLLREQYALLAEKALILAGRMKKFEGYIPQRTELEDDEWRRRFREPLEFFLAPSSGKQLPRFILHENGTVTLDGKNLEITPDQWICVKCIVEARGARVRGKDICKQCPTITRPDRMINGLPSELIKVLTTRVGTRTHYRIDPSLLT